MTDYAQCLLSGVHDEHDWAYTSEGGGHMVDLGDYDMKGYRECYCLGLRHMPRHRGHSTRPLLTDEIRNYRPRHKA